MSTARSELVIGLASPPPSRPQESDLSQHRGEGWVGTSSRISGIPHRKFRTLGGLLDVCIHWKGKYGFFWGTISVTSR